MKNWILSGCVMSLLGSGPLFAQQGMSKEEWIKHEAEKEFKDSTMSRLKSLEDRFKDPKTGKDKDAWWESLKFSGDVRYRHELIDTDTADTRNRHRIRVRFGLDAKVNEEVDFSFRVASGESADPVSTNQTLTGSYGKKSVFIDLAQVDYHPTGDIKVLLGKITNPFYQTGKSDLIWDHDLTPEGGAFKWVSSAEGWEMFANAGAFWIRENSSEADSGMLGIQGGMKLNLGTDQKLTIGLGHYDFLNDKGELVFGTASTSGFGNTTTGSSPSLKYANEFRVSEFFADYSFVMGETPVTVFGNYVDNGGTSTNDLGYFAGVEFGKVKDPGSWAFRYNIRKLQRDAVVGAFTDSDGGGGGTNYKGHKFQFEYQIAKKCTGTVTYFRNETGLAAGSDINYDRVQLDIQFKF